MTLKEKRLAIVKDALLQLEVTNVESMVYLSGPFETDNLTRDLEKCRKECKACALGTLFLSSVGLYNGKIPINCDGQLSNSNTSHCIENNLLSYFDEYQLNLIEVAFEGGDVNCWFDESGLIDEEYERAVEFCKNMSPRRRLEKILINIINNDGEFKPCS